MKKTLFGIALILFALVFLLSEVGLPIRGGLIDRSAFAVFAAFNGLVITGIGAFQKEK